MVQSAAPGPAAPSDAKKPAGMHPLKAQALDTQALLARYQAERDKRLREEGAAQFKRAQGPLSRFKEDLGAAPLARDAVTSETKVLIVGAGLAGVVAAVKLIGQGVEDFLIVDKAAGFGGTWYYNKYPGLACDVESYVYLPFLEETGYLPKERFTPGPEILEHFDRIVTKWDLRSRAYLQTKIESVVWDEGIRRWRVHTDHADRFVAQFVVLATGTLHEPKLPGISGIDEFRGRQFHSGRWDYGVTGGDPLGGRMTKLADKTVGIVGTGASAVGIVPVLARSARKLYVFQRTPSTIWPRENWKTDAAAMAATLTPGWQQARMDQLAAVLHGGPGEVVSDAAECTAAEGLEVLTLRELYREAEAAGVAVQPDEVAELMRLADLRRMEAVRRFIEETVRDRETAEKLKPWYSYLCKRPAFQREYLDAFNRPNVELVDTDGKGVSRLTASGVVANGREYPVDVLVYATGFDFFLSVPLRDRTGIELVGKRGQTLDEKWAKEQPSTLFGVHVPDFPNLFIVGPVQAGLSLTWLHTAYAAGDHIAAVVARVLRDGGYDVVEPSAEAAEEWSREIEEGAEMWLKYGQACSPGYGNNEGKPEEVSPRWGVYPKGVLAWSQAMREWREEGSMKGIEKR